MLLGRSGCSIGTIGGTDLPFSVHAATSIASHICVISMPAADSSFSSVHSDPPRRSAESGGSPSIKTDSRRHVTDSNSCVRSLP